MPKAGDKYIIEIAETSETPERYVLHAQEIDNNFLDDVENVAYTRGLNDAWEAAKSVVDFFCNSVSHEICKCFGEELNGMYFKEALKYIFANNTHVEAVEKIRAYEEQKKADEEIRVGDEVEDKHNCAGVVTRIHSVGNDIWCNVLYKKGNQYSTFVSNLTKTGRHFPQVVELLRELGGADNETN